MIGFPDIHEDLMRVNEVIDRDGVESGFEFVEEVEFDEKEEDLDEAENESGTQEKNAMPAGRKSVVGNNEEPGQQWKGLDNGDEKVAMKAAQKGADDVDRR